MSELTTSEWDRMLFGLQCAAEEVRQSSERFNPADYASPDQGHALEFELFDRLPRVIELCKRLREEQL